MSAPVENALEALEIQLLQKAMFHHYGFDFASQPPELLRQWIATQLKTEKLRTVSALQNRVLHDASAMQRMLVSWPAPTAALFGDPALYLAFREHAVPLLKTYPHVRIWLANCATGAELYSLAIVLHEEDMRDRAQVYATAANEAALKRLKSGALALVELDQSTANYAAAGGKSEFSSYYSAGKKNAALAPWLSKDVIFAEHRLWSDGSFNEFHAIFARGALCCFGRELQNKAHRLFYESLIRLGFLALDARGSLKTTPHEACYEAFAGSPNLQRKMR